MVRKILRVILYCIFPIYLIVMMLVYSDKTEAQICKDIVVNIIDSIDAPYLKKYEVERSLVRESKQILDKPFGEINTLNVERIISQNPIVRKVSCYKTPSGSVRIDIYQRNPIARVMGVDGDFFVDDDGAIMPVTNNYTAYVPIVSGYVTKETATKDILGLVKFINADEFWRAQITQIHVLSNKEIELIPRVGKHTILLGEIDEYDKKLNKLLLFYEKGLSKKGWNTYKAINLKYDNQVIGIK